MRNLNWLDLKHATVNDPEVIRSRAIKRRQALRYIRVAKQRLSNWKSISPVKRETQQTD